MIKLNPFGPTQFHQQMFLGIFCLAVFSGCMTKAVRNTGLRTETLEIHKVLISTNGSMAFECTAIYEHPTNWRRNGTPFPETGRSNKYLVGSSELIQASISNSVATPIHLKPKLINSDLNVVCITQLANNRDLTNSVHWQLIPNSYGGKDGKLSDLPVDFKNLTGTFPITTNTAEGSYYYPIPYNIGSVEYQLVFFNPSIADYRSFRKWWGYPTQILIVPAFTFDVVAFPIEFVVLAHRGYVE
jgi:hypothetical protein